MTSTERAKFLTFLGTALAPALSALNPQRPWTFVEPTEDTYTVYLRNAGKARIYLQLESSKGYDLNDRILVTGHMHIGKNGSYVEVYEDRRGENGTRWERVSAPRITVAVSKNPEAIAKDIAKRFLPEYLRVFALAEDKLAKDAAYECRIVTNLERLAECAGVPVAPQNYRGEVNNQFTMRIGERQYHSVSVTDHDADLKLDSLTFEQAEHIIKYLKQGK